MFTRGNLSFSVTGSAHGLVPTSVSSTIQGQSYEHPNQKISLFGVTGLPWGKLDPRQHFAMPVLANIRIQAAHPLNIMTSALIMRERTIYSEHMGLRFHMDEEQSQLLKHHIEKHGFYPTEYVRKYPRIPSSPMIQTFPLRALAIPDRSSEAPNSAIPTSPLTDFDVPIVFDVVNLSPNGVLLATENQNSMGLLPGQKLNMVLEPRGWFPLSIKVQGLICRITDDMDKQNGNLIRYLGIKFTKVDEINKAAFLDLLKDILNKTKAG